MFFSVCLGSLQSTSASSRSKDIDIYWWLKLSLGVDVSVHVCLSMAAQWWTKDLLFCFCFLTKHQSFSRAPVQPCLVLAVINAVIHYEHICVSRRCIKGLRFIFILFLILLTITLYFAVASCLASAFTLSLLWTQMYRSIDTTKSKKGIWNFERYRNIKIPTEKDQNNKSDTKSPQQIV